MKRTLKASNAALIVIDIQEAFRKAIAEFEQITRNANVCARGFEVLGFPVIVTEQYPRGLGHTAPEVLDSVNAPIVFEKSAFSAFGAEGLDEFLNDHSIDKVAVTGIETHVCVNQTVSDLLNRGIEVHLIEDAVGSRKTADRDTALRKMTASGVVPSTVEMALFELMSDSKHPEFKKIQALVK